MLRASEKISDLIFSPGRAPQVEISGQLARVKIGVVGVLSAEDTARTAGDLIGHNAHARRETQAGRLLRYFLQPAKAIAIPRDSSPSWTSAQSPRPPGTGFSTSVPSALAAHPQLCGSIRRRGFASRALKFRRAQKLYRRNSRSILRIAPARRRSIFNSRSSRTGTISFFPK